MLCARFPDSSLFQTWCHGCHTFSCSLPHLWISLPVHLCQPDSNTWFKSQLKTHLIISDWFYKPHVFYLILYFKFSTCCTINPDLVVNFVLYSNLVCFERHHYYYKSLTEMSQIWKSWLKFQSKHTEQHEQSTLHCYFIWFCFHKSTMYIGG